MNELSAADTVHGWKEIAAYLGKSVRAVQRWEADFGLPVHRIKTPNGQVVYACRREIDAWRASMETRPSSITAVDTAKKMGPWRSLYALGVLGLVVAGSLWLLAGRAGARTLSATRYEVTGTSLVAITNDGRRVWSHDFGWVPQPLKHRTANEAARALVADLDGDGRKEVVAVIQSPSAGGQTWRESVFCFTEHGFWNLPRGLRRR